MSELWVADLVAWGRAQMSAQPGWLPLGSDPGARGDAAVHQWWFHDSENLTMEHHVLPILHPRFGAGVL